MAIVHIGPRLGAKVYSTKGIFAGMDQKRLLQEAHIGPYAPHFNSAVQNVSKPK